MVKLLLYVKEGVGWIWLVDPSHHPVEVFETVEGRATLVVCASEDDVATLPPFNGEIDLAPWWSNP